MTKKKTSHLTTRPATPQARKPLVDPAELTPTLFEAQVKNITSDLEWASQGGIQVLELEEQSIWIETEARLCRLNHHVLLSLKITASSEKPIVFSSTARISSIEPQPQNRARIELTLLQYDKGTWRSLQDSLTAKQLKTQRTLEHLKGVG